MVGEANSEQCPRTADFEACRLLRDADIRISLTQWLKDQHRDELETAFYQELAIPRPTARADLAVVNGSLVGYEIKSDLDTAARLPAQIKSYGHIFERMYLVTTKRKDARLSAMVPAWWGIIHAGADGSMELARASKLNKKVSGEHVLYLLKLKELRKTIERLGIKLQKFSKKADIIAHIVKCARKSQIFSEVRLHLKERNSFLQSSSSNS